MAFPTMDLVIRSGRVQRWMTGVAEYSNGRPGTIDISIRWPARRLLGSCG